jgi:glycosyltransferase involved in cell wall biosynthesis
MDYEPLVSIVLPVHNAAGYITKCMESLLAQTYANIEIIVIDDFSKDASASLIHTLRKKDKRIRYFRNKKRYGLVVCYNRAVKRAKGSFIAFMNPHDISSPHRIKSQVQFLLNNPKLVAVGTQCIFVNKDNKRIGKSTFPHLHEMIYHTFLTGKALLFETMLINRTLLPKDLLYFTVASHPLLYADVFLKMLQYGEVANLPKFLYFHRKSTEMYQKTLPTLKLLLKSFAEYEYRPSLRALFAPLVRA